MSRLSIAKLLCIVIIIILLRLGFSIFYFNKYTTTTKLTYHSKNHLKYILQWTKPYTEPFKFLGSGQEAFIQRKCPVQNCFVTPDVEYFEEITDFDAILFHGPEILGKNIEMPLVRSSSQKYIFVCIESPHYYPDCTGAFNNFFNWTWTFKLDSDVPYNYLTVRDKDGHIIGPAANISWIQEMKPISDYVKKKLQNKTKAVAWFVSNCNSLSGREIIAEELQNELLVYNLTLDTYGKCGKLRCERSSEECFKKLENDYYFYLAFENSYAPDYVTEKLVNALLHFSVPVVLGKADYRRFMPDGIYLDIKKLGAEEVAKRINNAITNPKMYYEYFKWHNHYTYEETSVVGQAPDSDDYCKLCEMLNDPVYMERVTIWERFDEWWNWDVPNVCS